MIKLTSRITATLALSCALILTHSPARADVMISVTPTLAPNVYGSPSWNAWVQNSVTALEDGLTSYGDPTLPSYYQAQSDVTAEESIVTGFPSWLGQADPGTAFGPAYANEDGNRMTFGVTILGDGQKISISELGFTASSNDTNDDLAFGYNNGYTYSDSYVGVIFGTDGNPNTYITSGDPTTLVDAIYGRGSGNSEAAYCSGCDVADQQSQLDQTAAYMASIGLTQFTGTYYLSTDNQLSDAFASGSGTFNIAETPEPSTWLLAAAGIVAASCITGTQNLRSRQRFPR